MLRTLWILCMAWMIVLNSMVYSVICVNFQLNRSFISEMFCENKDIPMSECNGHCFLNKQLDKATDQQESDWMDFRADFNLFTLIGSNFSYQKWYFSSIIDNNMLWEMPTYLTHLFPIDKPPTSTSFFI